MQNLTMSDREKLGLVTEAGGHHSVTHTGFHSLLEKECLREGEHQAEPVCIKSLDQKKLTLVGRTHLQIKTGREIRQGQQSTTQVIRFSY